MIQHSKSVQKRCVETKFKTKNIDAEYFYDIVWCDLAS